MLRWISAPLGRGITRLLVFLSSCLVVSLSATPLRAFDDVIDSPMYKSPDLPMPRVVVVVEGEKDLWLKALQRPEADLRCKAADTIALAHRRGVKGLETTVGPLLAALDRPGQHPTVLLAAAQALIALDARQAAPSLLRQAQSGGSDLRNLIEPALARWDYQPARAVWLERLRDPATPQRNLVLAVQGLGTVREEQAVDRLRELVLSERTPGPIRLEAARALAQVRPDGLEKDAEPLAADASARGAVARLAAASLLRRHGGDEAVRLLQRLARDSDPAVSAVAVARLLEIDAGLVVPALDHLLASADGQLRSYAVEVLRQRPTEQHLRLMARRLDDDHPDVRRKARRSLYELAAKRESRDLILAEAERVLAAQRWQGQEQSAILLTQLDYKPAAGRLVELLRSERPEVGVTAAWGVRKLAVPETLPDATSHIERELNWLLNLPRPRPRPGLALEFVDHQLSQLLQFLGQQKYSPADALLRRLIPKPDKPIGPESRAAAIWALGLIHEGKTVPALATAFEARLNDVRLLPPEFDQVRYMSAIGLGRLGAKGALNSLRTYAPVQEWSQSPGGNACVWAIERLTGEAVPPPQTIQKVQRGWFLMSNQNPSK